MVFSSVEFILYFLPVFFLVYGVSPARYKNIILLIGSLFFYASGEKKYFMILPIFVVINYFLGLYLGQRKKSRYQKRLVLAVGVLMNIGLLAAFKLDAGQGVLPLGISFYTFQMLSYLADVYRGEISRERSVVSFAAYVTMFPQLTVGPIVKYDEVKRELRRRSFGAEEIQEGLGTFILGLSCKVLLADRIGLLWHEVQVRGFESISTPLAWLAAIAYSLQIYYDFYGYSLMAMGLGKMLGFQLPENFHNPYMARSVREFYRRWHMTLGRWFCRYVYIPLGGNRKGELRTILNLLVVWLLTSVWHGVTWNFLLWGGLLVMCIIIERQLDRLEVLKHLRVLPHLYVWIVIPITWMCFANTDFSQLQLYLSRMFGAEASGPIKNGDWQSALWNYKYLFGAGILCCSGLMQAFYRKWKGKLAGKLVLALLLWICVEHLLLEGNNPFMYFSF